VVDIATRAELAAAIDPQWVGVAIARKARLAHTCTGKNEISSYEIHTVYAKPLPGGVLSSENVAFTPEAAELKAGRKRRLYPDATVTVKPHPNRNYHPGCLGEIAPGDLYIEYIGDVGFAQRGVTYCRQCGLAEWGRSS
jgi:hypothetical protein